MKGTKTPASFFCRGGANGIREIEGEGDMICGEADLPAVMDVDGTARPYGEGCGGRAMSPLVLVNGCAAKGSNDARGDCDWAMAMKTKLCLSWERM